MLGLYVDLTKAFDTVSHEILLIKLHHYGIRGVVNSWFKSYLSNQRQFVSSNGVDSKIRTVKTGGGSHKAQV